LYLLQTGLIGPAGEAAPTHLAAWSSTEKTFTLPAGAKELRVPLTWTDGQGLTVTKTFVFTRGLYSVDLIYDVQNAGATPRKLASYSQFLRQWEHASRSYFDVETYSSKARPFMTARNPRPQRGERGRQQVLRNHHQWLARLRCSINSCRQSCRPPIKPHLYRLQVRDKEYLLSATGPAIDVAAGGKAQFREKLFVGPKLQSQLAATGPRLEADRRLRHLDRARAALFATLNWVHGAGRQLGWAIIIVTALIKLLFYP